VLGSVIIRDFLQRELIYMQMPMLRYFVYIYLGEFVASAVGNISVGIGIWFTQVEETGTSDAWVRCTCSMHHPNAQCPPPPSFSPPNIHLLTYSVAQKCSNIVRIVRIVRKNSARRWSYFCRNFPYAWRSHSCILLPLRSVFKCIYLFICSIAGKMSASVSRQTSIYMHIVHV